MLLAAQTSDDQDYRQFGVAHDKLRLQLRLRARDAPGRCRQLSVTDVRLQHLARPTSVVEASLRVQQFSYRDDQRKVFVVHDQFTKGDDRLALSMEYDALGRLAREHSNTTTKISATGSFTPRVKKHGLHSSLAVRYFFWSEPDPLRWFSRITAFYSRDSAVGLWEMQVKPKQSSDCRKRVLLLAISTSLTRPSSSNDLRIFSGESGR